MSNTAFYCLPTIIGSMPHTDPAKACALIVRYLKDIPTWPQLPRRAFPENMYVQFSEGFPGMVTADNRSYVDTAADYTKPLETLYQAYLDNDPARFPIGRDHAAGLYALLEQSGLSPRAVKGCVTGPLSWGITVTDENKKSILYHDVLGDAVPKFLKLKAAWEERELRKIAKDTIIFLDEPIMASYGSIAASGPFSQPGKIVEMLDEVFDGISGLKGIHCCGNTDWSIILKTKLDILNFDAYTYGASLALFPDEVKAFLGRGGCVGWGIVPNQEEPVSKESVASLKDRLLEAMAPFTRNGLSIKDVVRQGMLLPACGLAGMTEEAAERVLQMLTELSAEIRRKYG
jgi:methionine synthase II (cobalamin-independent)